MYTKLELSITLENKKSTFGMYQCNRFVLNIKMLNKDDRFEDKLLRGNVLYYSPENRITIASHWSYKKGFIGENMIYLPSVGDLNSEMVFNFSTDLERKDFLKRLYKTLKMWSINWSLFKYDFDNKFEVKNNIWKISYLRQMNYEQYF